MKKVIFWFLFFIFLSLPALSMAEIGDIYQKLTSSDGAARDYFGASVSISGDRALVGAKRDSDNGSYSGSAYVFEYINDAWEEVAKLTPSDGYPSHWFGASVSILGDRAIVGASGSAYIFEYRDGAWKEVAKLTASEGAGWFGCSVSLSGDRAIIGSQYGGENDSYSGSAFVFEYTDGTWKEVAKLSASDGTYRGYFGKSVSLSGDRAIIGASPQDRKGSAYFFEYTDGVWREVAKFTGRSSTADPDYFGMSVSLSGDHAVVGAWVESNSKGSAYFYEYTDGAWREVTKFTASDGVRTIGRSVSLSGNRAIVGSEGGCAYVFKHTEGAWKEVAKLTASDDATRRDHFGYSVSLSGDRAIVGTCDYYSDSSEPGKAYIFSVKIPGDFDGNGAVDFNDYYNIFLPAYGKCADDEGYDLACNLDDDDCVTLIDLQMFFLYYQNYMATVTP